MLGKDQSNAKMKVLNKAILFVGFFLLGHAAYSAGQCKYEHKVKSNVNIVLYLMRISKFNAFNVDRSFLRLAEEDYTTLPNDVSIFSTLQILVGHIIIPAKSHLLEVILTHCRLISLLNFHKFLWSLTDFKLIL